VIIPHRYQVPTAGRVILCSIHSIPMDNEDVNLVRGLVMIVYLASPSGLVEPIVVDIHRGLVVLVTYFATHEATNGSKSIASPHCQLSSSQQSSYLPSFYSSHRRPLSFLGIPRTIPVHHSSVHLPHIFTASDHAQHRHGLGKAREAEMEVSLSLTNPMVLLRSNGPLLCLSPSFV
jgi:hypothetical protein